MLYQTAEPAPWYFSALRRAFEGVKQEAMPAAQWKAWLASNRAKLGVKQEEVEHTGINEWLDLQQGKVTREQILDYLAQNGVRLEEVVLGESCNAFLIQQDGETIPEGEFSTLEEAERAVAELKENLGWENLDIVAGPAQDKTQFSQWQLPGGDEYREFAIVIPMGGKVLYRTPTAHSMGEKADVNRVVHI